MIVSERYLEFVLELLPIHTVELNAMGEGNAVLIPLAEDLIRTNFGHIGSCWDPGGSCNLFRGELGFIEQH